MEIPPLSFAVAVDDLQGAFQPNYFMILGLSESFRNKSQVLKNNFLSISCI